MKKHTERTFNGKINLCPTLAMTLIFLAAITTTGFGSDAGNPQQSYGSRGPAGFTEEQKNNYRTHHPKYLALKKTTASKTLTTQEARELINQAEEKILKPETLWNSAEDLLTVTQSGINNIDLKAEAYFRLANVFKHEFSRSERYRDLDDPQDCCEILLEMVRFFPQDNLWVQRAYYDLADNYMSLDWKTRNQELYKYMKLSRSIGDVFFNYGKNMLQTMADDSFLITEGGDNQVFSLQVLLQIEKMRPDITVYDQKGNIFDEIYGNTKDVDQDRLFNNRVLADKQLITEKTPPSNIIIKQFIDKKTAQRKRNGLVYYTWMDFNRLNEINKLLKKGNKPEVEYKPIGILYQIVEKAKPLQGPWDEDKIWEKYDLNPDSQICLKFPYMIREILANYEFQRGDYYMAKQDVQAAMKSYLEAGRIGYDMVPVKFNISILINNTILQSTKLSPEQIKNYKDLALKELETAEKIESSIYEYYRNPYEKNTAIRVIDALLKKYDQQKRGIADVSAKKDMENRIIQLERKKKEFLE
jgi:hypothetical protein